MENILIYLSVALVISEGLALIPALNGNGILDMVIKVLRAIAPKKK